MKKEAPIAAASIKESQQKQKETTNRQQKELSKTKQRKTELHS